MNFKNKIALITGASRGIGRAVGELLVKYGANVIGTATNKNGILTINNYKGNGIVLDISDIRSINFFLKQISSKYNDIDILINNVGIYSDKILIKMTEKEWTTVINSNINSLFYISKMVIKLMIKKRYGRIINIGSVVGSIGNFGQTNYALSKAGMIGFSKSLAKEVALYGITVNVVSPGFILTDMTLSLKRKYRYNILSNIPIKRFGTPKEVAETVIFLASDKAAYVTGQTIHVNGGMYMP